MLECFILIITQTRKNLVFSFLESLISKIDFTINSVPGKTRNAPGYSSKEGNVLLEGKITRIYLFIFFRVKVIFHLQFVHR